MQLFPPPTDNLYKFISIAGLLAVIVSLSVPVYFILNTRPRVTEFRIEASVLSVELKYLKQEIEEMRTGTDNVDRLNTQNNSARRTKLRELEIRQVRLDHAIAEAEWATRIMLILMVCVVLGSAGGGGLAGKGFALWYDRLQRYQDEIVKKQATG